VPSGTRSTSDGRAGARDGTASAARDRWNVLVLVLVMPPS
jgi:hypothetical protein